MNSTKKELDFFQNPFSAHKRKKKEGITAFSFSQQWALLELSLKCYLPLAIQCGLSSSLNKTLMSPLSCRASGLCKGLFVSILLGMDLVVQKFLCQLVSIVYLQLQTETTKKKKKRGWDGCRCTKFKNFKSPVCLKSNKTPLLVNYLAIY